MEELYKKIAKAGIILLALALVVITFYTPIHERILLKQFEKEMQHLNYRNPGTTTRGGTRIDTIKTDTINELDCKYIKEVF